MPVVIIPVGGRMAQDSVGMQNNVFYCQNLKQNNLRVNNTGKQLQYSKSIDKDLFVKSSLSSPAIVTPKPVNKLELTFDSIKKFFKPAFTGSTVLNDKELTLRNYRRNLIEKLLKELDDEKNPELEATIKLLGKLQSERALPKLIELFENETTTQNIKLEIASSLGNYHSFEAMQALVDSMNNSSLNSGIRSECALSLAQIKNRRASKPLYDIVNNKEENATVRSSATIALAEFPSARNNSILIETLNDQSPEVRASAARSIGILQNSEAVDSLITLLKDKSPSVVIEAVIALGSIKAEKAIPYIIESLNKNNSELTDSIITALRSINVECSNSLNSIVMNKSNSLEYRLNGITTIKMLNYKSSGEKLIRVIADNKEESLLRQEAISALSQFKCVEALGVLENILNSEQADPELQMKAAEAIGHIGKAESLNVLYNSLANVAAPDFQKALLSSVNELTKQNNNLTSVDINPLLMLLNSNNTELKLLVVEILGNIPVQESSKTLCDVLLFEAEPKLRTLAAKGLGQIKDKESIEPLFDALKNDDNSFVKVQSALSLYRLGQKESLEILAINNETPEIIRQAIVMALAVVGEKSPLIERYMRPGLNVPKIHTAGLTGKNIEIAIVDKPIDPTHPEFEDRIIIQPLEHGTMVGGNVAGRLTGVAPQAILHSYNAFNDDNIGLGEILEKIIDDKIAGKNNIRVINLSVGYDAKLYNDREVRAEAKRFSKAVNLANKAGISVVVAAGNEGQDRPVKENNIGTLNLLALNEKSVVVGAVDTNNTPDDSNDDTRAIFSSYPLPECKRQLDVMAPGINITLPYPGGGYKSVDGTSFSTPFVSGLIALMYEANPELSPEEARKILNETAVRLKAVPAYKQGNGEVNPFNAVYTALSQIDMQRAEKFKRKFES